MDITLTLTALEVATLESLRRSPEDSLDKVLCDVLLRPYADRHISRLFRSADLVKQDAVIDTLAEQPSRS
jgi:hypothetical protein